MKTATIGASLLVFALLATAPAQAQRFTQTNLVSDQAGVALNTDTHLVNPWGLAPGASGVFWASNNGTGTSTLYDPDGTVRSLVVTIPGGEPTGIVATAATDSAFDVPNGATTGRAAFIFVSESGTISAWSPAVDMTNAIVVASDTAAVYTGVALGGTPTDPLLYVADFKGGSIDVYDSSFAETTLAGTFTDPNLPAGYFPFNIANIGGQLYVAYAQHDAAGDEQPGGGLGVITVFDLQGNYVRRFATGAELNAPWAIVQAPAGFGTFGGDILVGNFGDGRILAFDQASGTFEEALRDSVGHSVEIDGLWGLAFGKTVSGPAVAQRLYFAAGIGDENHGLFGYLAVADTDTTVTPPVACENDSKGPGFWRKICGGPLTGHGPGGDFPGKGKGDEKGHGPFSNDPKGHGPFGGFGDHGPFGVGADSLDVLFACIGNDAAPNAFGTNGCFTAGCDLLRKVGDRTDRERAAQVLLLTRLNLCSGSVCDSLAITCGGTRDSLNVRRLGEVADSLDVLLCDNNGDANSLRRFVGLLSCVIDDEDRGDDNEQGDDDVKTIDVKTLSMNPARLGDGPVRFGLSSTTPSMVQLRVYDIRGRLVAEPMTSAMVSGSASATWDGKDFHGRSVAPGTYFYRAVSATGTATGRLLIIR